MARKLGQLLAAGFAAIGVAATVTFVWGGPKDANAQQGPAGITWVVSGRMQNPLQPRGEPWYRLEDPEYKIVCYTRFGDLSGGLFCAKK